MICIVMRRDIETATPQSALTGQPCREVCCLLICQLKCYHRIDFDFGQSSDLTLSIPQ